MGDGECDRARAECRVAGGKQQSKFLMLRMLPIPCLWNMATGTTKVRGYSIKACPDKNKKATMLQWNARQNIILHLLLLRSPKQSHLITVQQAPNQPLSPSSHSPLVLWVGGRTQLAKVAGKQMRRGDVAEKNLSFWEQKNTGTGKRRCPRQGWKVAVVLGLVTEAETACLMMTRQCIVYRLPQQKPLACPSPATEFALYLRQQESGSALQAY